MSIFSILRRKIGAERVGGGTVTEREEVGRGEVRWAMGGYGVGGGTVTERIDGPIYNVETAAACRAMYNSSFTARKVVDLVVEDMMVRWRRFLENGEKMGEGERRHQVKLVLSNAMKEARLCGSSLVLMVIKAQDLGMPLDIQRVREGDLQNLLVVDVQFATVLEIEQDIRSPNVGKAKRYQVSLPDGQMVEVDGSRVLQFDGHPRHLSDIGRYSMMMDNWGVSVLRPVLDIINDDTRLARAAAYLVNRACIDVVKIDSFAETLPIAEAVVHRDTPTLGELAQQMHSQKNAYSTIFMDSQNELERHTYTFTGLPDLMDRYARRLAAAAGVPQTRFWGASPMGMNATGEGDANNYAMLVTALQERLLTENLRRLDEVIARDIGLESAPEYEWLPIVDLSEMERANVAQARTATVVTAMGAGLVDVGEGRAGLLQEDVWGEIDPERVPEVMEIEKGGEDGGME